MMGDQRYFGKASDRTLDAAIAREWDSGLVCTAAILSRPCPLLTQSAAQQRVALFDHLVGGVQQAQRHVETKCICCF